MSQTNLFAKLGAPLANPRWSWGAIRTTDGVVFLRVWQDRTRRHDGARFVQVTHAEKFKDNPDNLGYRERLRHVERIREGASLFYGHV